jgi:hypothetical protein
MFIWYLRYEKRGSGKQARWNSALSEAEGFRGKAISVIED